MILFVGKIHQYVLVTGLAFLSQEIQRSTLVAAKYLGVEIAPAAHQVTGDKIVPHVNIRGLERIVSWIGGTVTLILA